MQGSSPLTRGKRERRTGQRYPPGLIPAHAGKTSTTAPSPSKRTAHPRSRGENVVDAVAGTVCEGLIPAHAGKTGQRQA